MPVRMPPTMITGSSIASKAPRSALPSSLILKGCALPIFFDWK
jgi:hypothetical protein